jgi:hypothetical protein
MQGGSCTARNAMRNIRLPSPSTHGTSIFAATVCRRSRFTPVFCRLSLTQRGGARSIRRLPGALVRRTSLGLIHELVGVQAQQGSSCSHSCCSTVVAWRLACPPLRAHKPRLRRRR